MGEKNGFFFRERETRSEKERRERVQFAKGKVGSSDCSVGVGGFLHNPANVCRRLTSAASCSPRTGREGFESSIRSMGKAESVK